MSVVFHQKQLTAAKWLIASMSLIVLSQVMMLMNNEPVKTAKWLHFGLIVVCLVVANAAIQLASRAKGIESKDVETR